MRPLTFSTGATHPTAILPAPAQTLVPVGRHNKEGKAERDSPPALL